MEINKDIPEHIYDRFMFYTALDKHERAGVVLRCLFEEIERIIEKNETNFKYTKADALFFFCFCVHGIIDNVTKFKHDFFGFKEDIDYSLILCIGSTEINEQYIEPFIVDFNKEYDRFDNIKRFEWNSEFLPNNLGEIIKQHIEFLKFNEKHAGNTLLSLFQDWINKKAIATVTEVTPKKEVIVPDDVEVVKMHSYSDMVDLIFYNHDVYKETNSIVEQRRNFNLKHAYLSMSNEVLRDFYETASEQAFDSLNLYQIFNILYYLVYIQSQWRAMIEGINNLNFIEIDKYKKKFHDQLLKLYNSPSEADEIGTNMMWDKAPFGSLDSNHFFHKMNKMPHGKMSKLFSEKMGGCFESGNQKGLPNNDFRVFKEFFSSDKYEVESKVKNFWIEYPRLQVACLLVYKEVTNGNFNIYDYIYNNAKTSTYKDISYVDPVKQRMNAKYLEGFAQYTQE